MSPLSLIVRELRHRRLNALLATLGLTAGVALLVVTRLLTAAGERETRRVVRDLGFNLRILPREADPAKYFANGFAEETLPEDAAQRLAASAGTFLTFNHLTATLERRLNLRGFDAIVSGTSPAIVGPGEKKPMGFSVPEGQVHAGRLIADRLGLRKGGPVELAGHSLTVEKILVESGTDDDIRLFTSLPDAQRILQLPGRISEIKAIDCLCLTADKDPLTQIRAELARLLPEGQVLQMRTMADARARQRQSAERFAALAEPLTVGIAGLWTALLAILNVRDRRNEIGLWRALGWGSARIASLVLGRAAALGFAGALLGFATGTALGLHFGPSIYPVTANAFAADTTLLAWALALTPAFAALAAFLPAMIAVAQDPADTLRTD